MSREDLNALADMAVKAAQHMLGKHGEFYPFGVTMGTDGKVAMNGAYDGDEHPLSADVITLLEEAFKKIAQEQKIRAAGICFDVRTIPPGQSEKIDAIQVRLEHEDGEAIDLFVPYRKGFFKKIKYGETFASKGTPIIFPPSNN